MSFLTLFKSGNAYNKIHYNNLRSILHIAKGVVSKCAEMFAVKYIKKIIENFEDISLETPLVGVS